VLERLQSNDAAAHAGRRVQGRLPSAGAGVGALKARRLRFPTDCASLDAVREMPAGVGAGSVAAFRPLLSVLLPVLPQGCRCSRKSNSTDQQQNGLAQRLFIQAE